MICRIELQALPNQYCSTLLNDQECDIQVRQLGSHLYLTLWVEDALIYQNALCSIGSVINGSEVLGFSGALYFVDNKGKDSPQWEELGDRWQLYYVSPDETLYDELTNARAVHN